MIKLGPNAYRACPICGTRYGMECLRCTYHPDEKTVIHDGAEQPLGVFTVDSLPTRYHAALNEVEAHARLTARSILELLREFEKATGAEVAKVKLDRAYAYGVPPELKIVDLKLNPMPAARVRAGKEKG